MVDYKVRKRLTQIAFSLLGLPSVLFFCIMTIPVMLFALPSVFIGNPLNILFVIWWGMGAYGIYSGICATVAFGESPFTLPLRQQIGISSGILAYIPLISVSLSGEIGFGAISTFMIRISFLGLLPAGILLALSLKKTNAEPTVPGHRPASLDSKAK